jgi:hypothetical protein
MPKRTSDIINMFVRNLDYTAFAGNARIKTAVVPLYSEIRPSCFLNSRKTSRAPFLYLSDISIDERKSEHDWFESCYMNWLIHIPLCNLDFNISTGIATNQLNNPAIPPATIVRQILNWYVLQWTINMILRECIACTMKIIDSSLLTDVLQALMLSLDHHMYRSRLPS